MSAKYNLNNNNYRGMLIIDYTGAEDSAIKSTLLGAI